MPPVPVPFPLTTTAPDIFIIAPPAIVNNFNADDINSAICVATLSAINLPNHFIVSDIVSPNSCNSGDKSDVDSFILSMVFSQLAIIPSLPKKSPLNADPNVLLSPFRNSGANLDDTSDRSIVNSPILRTAFAIALPYCFSIRSQDSSSAFLILSKFIS